MSSVNLKSTYNLHRSTKFNFEIELYTEIKPKLNFEIELLILCRDCEVKVSGLDAREQ